MMELQKERLAQYWELDFYQFKTEEKVWAFLENAWKACIIKGLGKKPGEYLVSTRKRKKPYIIYFDEIRSLDQMPDDIAEKYGNLPSI